MSTRKFLFGASTSAYQIEGNNIYSDWWKYEDIKSGEATNSFVLYKEDRKALQQINANCYRFSLEWSRIQPMKDFFSREALDHYKNLILDLKDHNIIPIVTLHHFTNPLWLEDMDGWANPDVVKYYLRYVDYVVNELKDLVEIWVTINEPNVYISSKYLFGIWHPKIKSLSKSYKVARNFYKAHKGAYKIIKGYSVKAKVGISINTTKFIPTRNIYYIFNLLLSVILNYFNNNFLFKILYKYIDYLGINFYTRVQFSFKFRNNPIFETYPPFLKMKNISFVQYPSDLLWVLKRLKKLNKPILITENGIPTENDTERVKYLYEIFEILKRARRKGINLMGYIHWSLIDNFEWSYGYLPKFGLYSVESKTFKRISKESSKIYSKLIEEW